MLEPTDITLDLTYKCNRACTFCFLDCTDLKSENRKKLSTGEIKAFVDSMGSVKRQFNIAGGEPLLRRDLLEIIGHIKKRSHRCLIKTNGTLLDESTCSALLAMKVDEIVISVHGDRATHDRLVGTKGSFELLEKAARRIQASRHKAGTFLSFWCTINGLNHSSLYKTYLALKKLAPDNIAFNHLDYINPSDRAKTSRIFHNALRSLLLPRSSSAMARAVDPGRLAVEIARIKAADRGSHTGARAACGVKFLPQLTPRQIRAWYGKDACFKKTGFCMAQWNQIWLSPWGDVVSCVPLTHRMGNIRQRPWREIYNGPKFTAFRKVLIEAGGLLPICSRCGRESYFCGKKPSW